MVLYLVASACRLRPDAAVFSGGSVDTQLRSLRIPACGARNRIRCAGAGVVCDQRPGQSKRRRSPARGPGRGQSGLRDTVDAGPGDDRIFSLDDFFTRTGGSKIACGPGNDWFEPEAADVASGCEQLFEEWPVTVRLCRVCALMVEAKIGSRVFSVGRLRVALSSKKLWGVIPLSQRARALVRSRGTLRVRLVGMSGARGAYARDWFVLKR
jgi:hypothetical protein